MKPTQQSEYVRWKNFIKKGCIPRDGFDISQAVNSFAWTSEVLAILKTNFVYAVKTLGLI
jgi:hypothetical protein